MSLTVATSSLDLGWQEIDAVSWTAGTLADIAACVTEVESRLRRGTLTTDTTPSTTEINRWLIKAKQVLMSYRGFTWARRYAYADTTAGTYRYALPPDFGGGKVSLKIVTDSYERQIELWPNAIFDAKYPDPSYYGQGSPDVGTIKNQELWFRHAADGTYSMELEYERSGSDQTTTDFTYIPEADRWSCCDYATYQAFLSLKEFDSATVYKGEWGEMLMRARKADGRRRWSTQRFQCPPWM